MELPVRVLVSGTFGSFCCPLRFITQEGEVEIPETDFPRIHIIRDNLATRASGEAFAIRSLVVAEFDQGHLGVGVAHKIGGLADQVFHHLIDLGSLCGVHRGGRASSHLGGAG